MGENMYIKVVYSNGYGGCDEETYVEVKDEEEAGIYFDENADFYSFFEPDERFIDTEDDEAYNLYQQDIWDNSYWEEVSEEEYRENTED